MPRDVACWRRTLCHGVAQFEKTGLPGQEPSAWDDMVFCITDTMIIFDRVRHTLKVVANAHIDGNPGAIR